MKSAFVLVRVLSWLSSFPYSRLAGVCLQFYDQLCLRSERLAAGEAGFDLVPPFDLIALAQLPAEQDDAPVAQ